MPVSAAASALPFFEAEAKVRQIATAGERGKQGGHGKKKASGPIGPLAKRRARDDAANAFAPPVPRWVDMDRVRASLSPDVRARAEDYSLDDRTHEVKSAQASQALRERVPPRFTFGVQVKVKQARPKRERTPEVSEYFRNYQRERRAREKAESAGFPSGSRPSIVF